MKNFLFLISLLFLFGCKVEGTDTGNPVADTPAASTAMGSLIKASCAKLISCNPSANENDCYQNSRQETSFGAPVGLLAPYQALTLEEIIAREILGEFVPLQTAVDACGTDIQNLSCGDATVQNAYNTGLTNFYRDLYLMLPASCADIYN
jgi:hypothetical protein